jgi:hypothetical protein
MTKSALKLDYKDTVYVDYPKMNALIVAFNNGDNTALYPLLEQLAGIGRIVIKDWFDWFDQEIKVEYFQQVILELLKLIHRKILKPMPGMVQFVRSKIENGLRRYRFESGDLQASKRLTVTVSFIDVQGYSKTTSEDVAEWKSNIITYYTALWSVRHTFRYYSEGEKEVMEYCLEYRLASGLWPGVVYLAKRFTISSKYARQMLNQTMFRFNRVVYILSKRGIVIGDEWKKHPDILRILLKDLPSTTTILMPPSSL